MYFFIIAAPNFHDFISKFLYLPSIKIFLIDIPLERKGMLSPNEKLFSSKALIQ